MARHVLMRIPGEEPRLIPEQAIPLEKDLHDVLTEHPELIPAEDLQLGRLVVVGRESALASGYADLVCIDQHGDVCLVEVKKEGNPDTRRVVAQLLDYAGALWRRPVHDLERDVLHAHLAGIDPPSLSDFLSSEFDEPDKEDPDVASAQRMQRLEQNLATGEFALVVAAPTIPDSVARVLEYLNAQGLRLFALEVSFFKGGDESDPECYVPRVVVMPRVADPGGGGSVKTPIDRAAFIAALRDDLQAPIDGFIDSAAEAGAIVTWKGYGPSIDVLRNVRRQVASIDASRMWITLKAPSDWPEQPFAIARAALSALQVGTESKDAYYRTIAWSSADVSAVVSALDVVLTLIRDVAPSIEYENIAPVISEFERNDHNIWVKAVPALQPLLGHQLRGTLTRLSSERACGVVLIPLAKDQPGWRPVAPQGLHDVWPPGVAGERYRLELTAAAQTQPPHHL